MAASGLDCGMQTLSCGTWAEVPWLGIELRPPALGAQNLSQWPTREVWSFQIVSCIVSLPCLIIFHCLQDQVQISWQDIEGSPRLTLSSSFWLPILRWSLTFQALPGSCLYLLCFLSSTRNALCLFFHLEKSPFLPLSQWFLATSSFAPRDALAITELSLARWPCVCYWSKLQCCRISYKAHVSCPILCDPMDCSPPGSSVQVILLARMLEWVAISSSRGSFWPRGRTWVSYVSCITKENTKTNHENICTFNVF